MNQLLQYRYVVLLFRAEYLQANKHNSLQVQALHDLGNLHFFNGNRKYDVLNALFSCFVY